MAVSIWHLINCCFSIVITHFWLHAFSGTYMHCVFYYCTATSFSNFQKHWLFKIPINHFLFGIFSTSPTPSPPTFSGLSHIFVLISKIPYNYILLYFPIYPHETVVNVRSTIIKMYRRISWQYCALKSASADSRSLVLSCFVFFTAKNGFQIQNNTDTIQPVGTYVVLRVVHSRTVSHLQKSRKKSYFFKLLLL